MLSVHSSSVLTAKNFKFCATFSSYLFEAMIRHTLKLFNALQYKERKLVGKARKKCTEKHMPEAGDIFPTPDFNCFFSYLSKCHQIGQCAVLACCPFCNIAALISFTKLKINHILKILAGKITPFAPSARDHKVHTSVECYLPGGYRKYN